MQFSIGGEGGLCYLPGMSIWGKIIGGAAGLALGGPIGGLLGVVLGAAVDVGVERVQPASRTNRQVAFTIGVIALSAKMAKADGRVTREEVAAFKQVFRVPVEEMRNVGRIFDLARQDTAGYEAYARQLARLMQGQPLVLRNVLEALFYIALADGELHPDERTFLENVARLFGLSEDEFDAVARQFDAENTQDPYVVLGVSRTASKSEVRARYMALVRAHHPDKLMAEGVPADMIAVATQKVAQINAAYDTITQKISARDH